MLENIYRMIEFSFILFYDIITRRNEIMEIKTGYIYHIKDEFFDKINMLVEEELCK